MSIVWHEPLRILALNAPAYNLFTNETCGLLLCACTTVRSEESDMPGVHVTSELIIIEGFMKTNSLSPPIACGSDCEAQSSMI